MSKKLKASIKSFLISSVPYAILGLAILAVSLGTAVALGIITFITTGGDWSETLRVFWNTMFLGATAAGVVLLALIVWPRL